MKYICNICGWVYDESCGDPENGFETDTLFEDLPEDYQCPFCYAEKDEFSEVDE